MKAKRVPEIESSLAFAKSANAELSGLIADAQKSDGTVDFIGHKVGAILQGARQCYDYCAADLRDDFLGNSALRAYYPFHPDSLAKGKPFYQLSDSAPAAYESLMRIANCIISKQVIPRTICRYSDAASINDLVNQNKHDRVKEICELGRSRTRIEFPDGSVISVTPMYPFRDDGTPDFSQPGAVGPEEWISTPGVKVTAVKDFFFAENAALSRADVHGFCMAAITATRFILSEVYSASYGVPADLFHER